MREDLKKMEGEESLQDRKCQNSYRVMTVECQKAYVEQFMNA